MSLPSNSGELIADRFRLENELNSSPETSSWRGFDLRLGRRVSIRLVQAGSPLLAYAKQAAIMVASTEHAGLIPVLDIEQEADYLAIISDWSDWPTYAFTAREPLPIQDALTLAQATAKSLLPLHRSGQAHGRLMPQVVHVNNCEVRIRGQLVDAVLFGKPASVATLQKNDLVAVLSLLTLAVTGRWVDPFAEATTKHDLCPGTYAELPAWLDHLVAYCYDEIGADRMDLTALVATLDVSAEDNADQHSRRFSGGLALAARATLVVVVGLASAALVMAGFTQSSLADSAQQPPTEVFDGQIVTPPPTLPPVDSWEKPISIVRLGTLDPDGDQVEYPDLLPNIVDNDLGTAWTTKPYFTADVGGKRGVGVIFDLGTVQQVSALQLELIGTSSNFNIGLSQATNPKFEDFELVADVKGAGQSVFVRLPAGSEGRRVLIWFTQLSEVSTSAYSDPGFRGGIRHAVVFGPVTGQDQ